MGLSTQQEIVDWHTFCAAQPYPDIKSKLFLQGCMKSLTVFETGMRTN
jgi:hypothetical protein